MVATAPNVVDGADVTGEERLEPFANFLFFGGGTRVFPAGGLSTGANSVPVTAAVMVVVPDETSTVL